MAIVVAIWIGVAILCAVLASKKGRDPTGWFLLGLFFSIFALLPLLSLGDGPIQREAPPRAPKNRFTFGSVLF
jgi:hypothetical protein